MTPQERGTSYDPVTRADADMIAKDKRQNIPDTLSGLSVLPDGSWYGISRPLADDYGVPGRGVEGHGTDSDTKAEDYEPNPAGNYQYESDDGKWADIIPPTPLYVAVVPDPLKSITKASYTRVIIGALIDYQRAAFTGAEINTALIIARDESRVKLTLTVAGNQTSLVANQLLKYTFAVSHDSAFPPGSYLILDPVVNTKYEFIGTEPLYVTIYPIAAQDNSKANTLVLNAIFENQAMVDYQPSGNSNHVRSYG